MSEAADRIRASEGGGGLAGRPIEAVRRIAARQHVLLGREQVLALGLTSSALGRLVRAGSFRHELPGVYAVAGSTRSREQRLLAASLWAGDGSAVSHRAAATLWKLDGLPVDGPPEITSPRSLESRRVVTHRGRLAPREVT